MASEGLTTKYTKHTKSEFAFVYFVYFVVQLDLRITRRPCTRISPRAIAATQATRVIVTHGSVPVMVRYLQERGLRAGSFQTEYGDENFEEKVQIAGIESAQSATDFVVDESKT